MTYPEVVKYLESFINYESVRRYRYKKSLGVKRIKGFLSFIGDPQEGMRFIHVAGSKGKGSTCAFIAYILKESGYKVGLYTSPHLADFRERIRVLPGRRKNEFEGMISRRGLKDLVQKILPAVEEYNRISSYGVLTFFEVYTALAIRYFKEEKVDFAVLEAGLGGRLDATNAVNAVISVITPISYEHTDKLGKTLKEIAQEKAGIIKGREAIVISAPQNREVGGVIRARCKNLGVKLLAVGRCRRLKLGLCGRHQLVNANTALKAVCALKIRGVKIKDNCIRGGLYKVVWPARCELIRQRPYVVLDGAQNVASAEALKDAIKNNFKYDKLILVLGISSDKDIKGICSKLYSLADKVILTKANNLRGLDPRSLADNFKGKESYITTSVYQARNLSMRLAKRSDLILVAGSLFVAGEFKYGVRRYS